MSRPADVADTPDVPAGNEGHPEGLTFTLQIVSPSVGVASPLSFPRLPATTTVKILKAKIRDALPSKPADESQRLIHRGRMLGREMETMLDIFGQQTLESSDVQTLHLVLRPSAADAAPIPAAVSIPVPGVQPPANNPLPQTFPPRPQSTPANPFQGMHAQQPLPGFQQVQQHQVLHQVEHIQNVMAQRLQQLQRETQRLHQEMVLLDQRARGQPPHGSPLVGPQLAAGQPPIPPPHGLFQVPPRPTQAVPATLQNLINQQQRERAAEGRQGVQDASVNGAHSGSVLTPSSGRASPNTHRPDHTTTYTREGIGPNGERWHMTVNETTTTIPAGQAHHNPHPLHHTVQHGHPNPALDIQAVLRNADRYLNSQNVHNMQRSASNPPVTTAQFPSGSSTPAIPRPGTPATSAPLGAVNNSPALLLNPGLNAGFPAFNTIPQANVNAPNPTNEPVVYILSDPRGPRALLVSNAETFFTLRQHSRRHHSPAPLGQARGPVGLPEYRNRPAQRPAQAPARRANWQEPANDFEPVAPHANPGAGALAAQLGPILWLIIRLVGFVWFFTAGNPSWTRWFMVSGLALLVFIINTGVFNGLAEEIWGPIRRHLEGLIPLADPARPAAAVAADHEAGGPAGNNIPREQRRPGELDPAEVAARLLEERRRADGGWLMAQVRRAEHSLLLFLASLVPGVGERHIQAREAEAAVAEAERQRQIEAANAAENTAENVENNNPADGEGSGTEAGANQDNEHQPAEAEGVAAPAQPLVEI